MLVCHRLYPGPHGVGGPQFKSFKEVRGLCYSMCWITDTDNQDEIFNCWIGHHRDSRDFINFVALAELILGWRKRKPNCQG